jgi:hypothetical protein
VSGKGPGSGILEPDVVLADESAEDRVGFKVGDRVVYPHHGAAVIERKEKREMFGRRSSTWS